jgi:type VI secretion system secreted protein Hcp
VRLYIVSESGVHVDFGGNVMAAVDFFIKFDGIKGESTDAKHKDEIDVQSWSWGETNVGGGGAAGGGAGAGKVTQQDFHFTMQVNRASVGLMRACATGQHIKSATFSARRAGKNQQEYLTFKFNDVLVSSFQTGGSEATGTVVDQVGFAFAKMEVDYLPQQADGTTAAPVQFGFDVRASKAF